MNIGIMGAGNIGLAVAKTLSRAGIAATLFSTGLRWVASRA